MLDLETMSALEALAQIPPTSTMIEVRICSHIHGQDYHGRWFPESKRNALQWNIGMGNANFGAESHWLQERTA